MTELLFSLAIHKYKILSVFWNIFLALTPCFVVYFAAIPIGRKKWGALKNIDRMSFIILFLFWLLFFPNTAYLFTLPRHLVNLCADYGRTRICFEEMWVVLFFFTYAVVGIPTFYYALNRMSRILGKIFFQKLSVIFPIVMIPLTALGVLLGLFERFNTWQIISQPWEIMKASTFYFTFPILLLNFLVFTASLYLIYYGLDIFIWKIIKKK